MEKQTAVDWLWDKLVLEAKTNYTDLLVVAKQMEEEQAFEHFKAGQDSMEEGGKSFDQYYNEKYGK